MSASSPAPSCPHLRAAVLALTVLGLLLAFSGPAFNRTVEPRVDDLITSPLPVKNQGEWIQRRAFAADDVLPVYASSELTILMRDRPDEFFRSKPTGFRICPVGVAGNTSLLIAEKLAALGGAIRGKKLAIILSGTWFCRQGVPEDSYAGNFSPLQAGSLLLQDDLDRGLKHRFARRMLEFPDSVLPHPPLGSYLQLYEAKGKWSRAMRSLVTPMMWVSRAELGWEDRFATFTTAAGFERRRPASCGTVDQGTNYDRLIAGLERSEDPEPDRDLWTEGGDNDELFLAEMNGSREWGDFDLLLDTLAHYQARVLMLSVPLPGRHFDRHEVSRAARAKFYQRLEDTCAARGVPCFDFSDHERDEDFTLPGTSHFRRKGWLHVNRLLDAFYHDQLPVPPRTPSHATPPETSHGP